MDKLYNYVRQTPTAVTNEQYTDVDESFTLGDHKRAFLASSFVLTQTEGGTPLTRGSDYELDEKDVFYSQVAYENEDVFTKVNILNSTYETGDLFATYDAVLTYATTEAVRSIGLPAGAIIAYGSTVAPSGYLLCDGAAVSRTTYADLFAAIGTTWGAPDSDTFNVPDGSGGVLRGTGTGTVNGRDKVGPAVGDKQEDQMQQITGYVQGRGLATDQQSQSGALAWSSSYSNNQAQIQAGTVDSRITLDSADSPDARASDEPDGETRAYGIGVQFIIKT